jgi:hypothetical protein
MEKFNWNKKDPLWKISKFESVVAKVKPHRKGESDNASGKSEKGNSSNPENISISIQNKSRS